MAYATTADLYNYLPQLTPSAETDALLQDALDRAEQIVNRYLQFEFAAYPATATDQDVYSGNGGHYLYLPHHQADSVTGVTQIASRGMTSETGTAITDYVVESRNRLYRAAEWMQRTWFRVTAKWGVGPVPDDVVEVTLEVAVNLWRMKDAGSWPSQGAEDGGAMRIPRALTWAQRSILDAVRMQYWGADRE